MSTLKVISISAITALVVIILNDSYENMKLHYAWEAIDAQCNDKGGAMMPVLLPLNTAVCMDRRSNFIIIETD